MKVQLLGTGAADGWPTPFCRCASCEQASALGHVRRQTSALVDDSVLIDCGAETARSAVQAGRRLDSLRLVLFTHAHPDHCDPQALLWRSWAGLSDRLVVAGPPDALELCRPWIAPEDPIDLQVMTPGSRLEIPGYVVEAVAATHSPGALLYVLTSSQGARLLYATDTGPMSDETVTALAGRRLDAAFIEHTWGDRVDHGTAHLDARSFPQTLRRLRAVEALTDASDVVAIHLGHDNPAEPDLSRRLSTWGARAVLDHDVVQVGVRSDGVLDVSSTSADHSRRRTLLIGGARSGKSREAERLVAADADVTYVATGGARPDDPEWRERVAAHQARRPSHWRTIETIDVAQVVREAAPGTTVLVDCVSLWVTRQLDHSQAWDRLPTESAATIAREFSPTLRELTQALRTTRARIVCVTNEVGAGIVPDSASGRLFRDLLGLVNAAVAAECDDVHLIVAGRSHPI